MIVLLNTLAMPLTIQIAKFLTACYGGDSAFLDLHHVKNNQPLNPHPAYGTLSHVLSS